MSCTKSSRWGSWNCLKVSTHYDTECTLFLFIGVCYIKKWWVLSLPLSLTHTNTQTQTQGERLAKNDTKFWRQRHNQEWMDQQMNNKSKRWNFSKRCTKCAYLFQYGDEESGSNITTKVSKLFERPYAQSKEWWEEVSPGLADDPVRRLVPWECFAGTQLNEPLCAQRIRHVWKDELPQSKPSGLRLLISPSRAVEWR